MIRFVLLLAIIGCTRDRLVGLDEAPNLVLSQTHQSFGELPLGTSATATVRVSNNGSAPSDLLAPTLKGDAAFTVGGTCAGEVLTPGASCELRVTFVPAALGSAVATVAITAQLAVAVDGFGMPQPAPNLVLSTARQSFGSVQVGTNVAATVQVSNSGTAPSLPLSPSLAGDPAFTLGGTCAGALAPGASCELRLTFAPTRVGSAAATVAIGGSLALPVDGSGRSTVTLSLQSTGSGSIDLCGAANACVVSFEVGDTSKTAEIHATAADGWSLFAWSGDCAGSGSSCQLQMDRDRSAGVTFVRLATLTVDATAVAGGGGTIQTDPSNTCQVPCRLTATVLAESRVTVHAQPDAASQFRWTGGCHAGAGDCTILVDTATSVTAVFNGANFVFVTSTMHSSAEGVAAYDAACNASAQDGGLPGPYLAWITTTTTPAESRMGNARGFIRLDGLPFMDVLNPAAPTDYPVVFDEQGQQLMTGDLFERMYLSGRSIFGGGMVATCHDWTSDDPSTGNIVIGDPLGGFTFWDGAASGGGCGLQWRLLCVGTALTRPLRKDPVAGRFAFVSTAGEFFAPDRGIAAFDAECANEASTARLPGTYKALVAADGASAASRFDLNGPPWVRPDGVALFAKAADLAPGTLMSPFDVYADGTQDGTSFGFWTGAATPSAPGTPETTCNGWTSSSPAVNNIRGRNLTIEPAAWFDLTTGTCDQPARIYCLQE
jgi:hypothetical protein